MEPWHRSKDNRARSIDSWLAFFSLSLACGLWSTRTTSTLSRANAIRMCYIDSAAWGFGKTNEWDCQCWAYEDSIDSQSNSARTGLQIDKNACAYWRQSRTGISCCNDLLLHHNAAGTSLWGAKRRGSSNLVVRAVCSNSGTSESPMYEWWFSQSANSQLTSPYEFPTWS